MSRESEDALERRLGRLDTFHSVHQLFDTVYAALPDARDQRIAVYLGHRAGSFGQRNKMHRRLERKRRLLREQPDELGQVAL